MEREKAKKYKVGCDIGGTFSDIVFLNEDGDLLVSKVPSTPQDYSKAIVNGFNEIITDSGLNSSDIIQILHSYTVATNAILEHRGARTGLLFASVSRVWPMVVRGLLIRSCSTAQIV